jgi:hypothetical protein
VSRSLHNFFRLYRAFDHVDDRLASDFHFYSRAVAYLQDRYAGTGVYGASCLTGLHLIHIAVLCGLFPALFMSLSEIGIDTNSYTYLEEWEGMSEHQEDTHQMLACVGHQLNLPSFLVKNIVCKFGQEQLTEPPKPKPVSSRSTKYDQKKVIRKRKNPAKRRSKGTWPVFKRKTPYRDSIYEDQALYYLDASSCLVRVFRKSASVVQTRLSQRYPLDTKHSVPVGSVPFSYWQKRVKGILPMKGGTRNHLKLQRPASGRHRLKARNWSPTNPR